MNNYRKVRITNQKEEMIIITNAPFQTLIEECRKLNQEIQDGSMDEEDKEHAISLLLNNLTPNGYYVNLIFFGPGQFKDDRIYLDMDLIGWVEHYYVSNEPRFSL